jgi:hypothetical protein
MSDSIADCAVDVTVTDCDVTDCDATMEGIGGSVGGRAALQRIRPAQIPQSTRKIVKTRRQRLTEQSDGLFFSGFTSKTTGPAGSRRALRHV